MSFFESVEVTVLDNGFTVVTDYFPNHPITSASIVCGSGGYQDPLDKLGLAHLWEHMLTHSHPEKTQRDYFQMVQRLAIRANFSTASDHIVAHADGRGASVREFLKFAAPCFTSRHYSNDAFLHERREVMNEAAEHAAMESSRRRAAQLSSLFGAHARPVLGFAGAAAHIQNITRTDLDAFSHKHVVGANMMLISAGDISHEESVAFAREHFSALERSARAPRFESALSMSDMQYPIPSYQDVHAGIMLRFDASHLYRNQTTAKKLDLVETFLTSAFLDDLRINGGGINGANAQFINMCGREGVLSIDTGCPPDAYENTVMRIGATLQAVARGDSRYRELFDLTHETVDNLYGEMGAMMALDMSRRRGRITDCFLKEGGIYNEVEEREILQSTSFEEAAHIINDVCFERGALTVEHYGHIGPAQMSGAQIAQRLAMPRLRAVA